MDAMWSLLISLSLLLAVEAKVVPKTEKSLATANVQSDAVKLDGVTSEHDLLQEMLQQRAKQRDSSEEKSSSSDEDKMGHKAKISDIRDGPTIMRSNEMSEPASIPDSGSSENSKLVNMNIKIKPRAEDALMVRSSSKEASDKKTSLVGELLRNLQNKRIETKRSQNETVTDALKKRLRKLDYSDKSQDDYNNTAKINWKIVNEGHQTIIIL